MKFQALPLLGAMLILFAVIGCSTPDLFKWESTGKNEAMTEQQAQMDAIVKADAAAKSKSEAAAKAKAEEKMQAQINARVKAELEARAKAEAEAKAKIPHCGEDLLKAFLKNDAEKFLDLLPDVVREEFGTIGFEKTVESMKEQLGTPVSYEFVFNLEHPKFTVSIWKVRFERDNTDKTKKIYQEALFRAVSGKIDGQDKLLGFNFF